MPSITSVISEFAHPPWGSLERETPGTIIGPGPISGSLTRVRGPLQVDAFGLSWDIITAAPHVGTQAGVVVKYQVPFLKLGARYTDFAHHDMYGELLDIDQEGLYWLWAQPAPTAIDYFVYSGFTIEAFFLVAL